MVDDFTRSRPPKVRRPGPDAFLSDSEAITLAIFARFSRFVSERDFHRHAESNLADTFPTLPERSHLNRRALARSRASSRKSPCIWRR
ncbi:MAG: hypothetical protein H0T74_13575 [Rubrobacteraceae bacterium]|nr:hypothetical protein [Rubrobacteraceae bacterium]